MTETHRYSREGLLMLLWPEALPSLNNWLERGDSVLVYENRDLGHPGLGHVVFISFGSAEAQIERTEFATPPEFLPNGLPATNYVGWRYVLQGIYQGESL